MKKKIIALVLLCSLLLGICSVAQARAIELTFGNAYVDGKTSDRVHLREGASQSSASKGLYFTGTPIYYEYATADQAWVWVMIGNEAGYMMSEYISTSSVASQCPTGVLKSPNGGKVNLRAEASASSDALLTVSAGSKVTIHGELASKWCYVDYGGTNCYVMSKFVSSSSASGSGGGNTTSSVTSAVINNKSATDRLNLRAKASTSSISLGKYYTGVVVDILSVNKSGWSKVRIGNLVGYMQQSYLVPMAKSGGISQNMPILTIPSGSGTVFLYESQVSSSKVLDNSCTQGTQLQLLGVAEDWYHVQVNGKIGFMLRSLVDPNGLYTFSNENPGTPPSNVATLAYVDNYSNTNRLNLREKPSTSALSLGKYYSGVLVNVLKTVESGGITWKLVRIGSLEGYMQADYLVNSPNANTMPVVPVVNDLAIIHELQSDTAFGITCGIGNNVTILGVTENWYHVQNDGNIGFMQKIYVDPKGVYGF